MPFQNREEYLRYQREYGRTRRPDQAKRSALRRMDPMYNAAQIVRKRRWRAQNRERHLAVSRAYDAKQLRENLQRRISKNLRHRIYKAMLGRTRGVSAVKDLGISIQEFRTYIERQFAPGMTWDNYGRWHLDHKRTLASFDLTDQDQARAACHFTNYQPLWALDNQRKYAGKPHPGTWAENYEEAWRVVTEAADPL